MFPEGPGRAGRGRCCRPRGAVPFSGALRFPGLGHRAVTGLTLVLTSGLARLPRALGPRRSAPGAARGRPGPSSPAAGAAVPARPGRVAAAHGRSAPAGPAAVPRAGRRLALGTGTARQRGPERGRQLRAPHALPRLLPAVLAPLAHSRLGASLPCPWELGTLPHCFCQDFSGARLCSRPVQVQPVLGTPWRAEPAGNWAAPSGWALPWALQSCCSPSPYPW